MEVIILAGGLGTRLRKVLPDLPKPMAPVGDKPFLYYLLSWLEQNNAERIILSTGYRSDRIKDYFGTLFGSMTIRYMCEEHPLGTGGAIKYALTATSGDNVLIVNGDTWFPVDLSRFSTFHASGRNLFSMALKKMTDFSRYGTVEFRDGTIFSFSEKKFCREGLINGGIYLMDRNFIEDRDLPDKFSLEKDLLEKEAASLIIKGMIFDAPFLDIGIPEDLRRAGMIPGSTDNMMKK